MGSGLVRVATYLQRWQAIDETRSRSINTFLFGYHAAGAGRQFVVSRTSCCTGSTIGAPFWMARIGIDIYGHNGVSVGDIDGDGFDDLYVCQPAGLPNRLYRNRGDGTFEDITEGSGVGILENTACAIFADFDNDGRQDLVVVRANGPLLFLNQGGGKFRHKAGRISVCKYAARDIYRRGGGRLQPGRITRYLLLFVCLLPGNGPVQVSSSLLRRQ